jgi:excisionase family DNA binding protein
VASITGRPAPLLNAQQAAELLGVPPTWVLAQARRGAIPHVRLGRYVRFRADDLEQWAQTRARGPRAVA